MSRAEHGHLALYALDKHAQKDDGRTRLGLPGRSPIFDFLNPTNPVINYFVCRLHAMHTSFAGLHRCGLVRLNW